MSEAVTPADAVIRLDRVSKVFGKAGTDGQFEIVWDSGAEPLKPDPYLKTYSWGAAVAA